MRLSNGQIILSPSDLLRFQACEHASALDLRLLRGDAIRPAEESPDALLLQKKGDIHEDEYRARRQKSSLDLVSIDRSDDGFDVTVEKTREAMVAGASVIFQGALQNGRWQGYSDFLERVDVPSALGSHSYEVVDTKLKRRADPRHAVQIALYSNCVARVQERVPEHGHVELGSGERATFPIAQVRNYADNLAARLELFVSAPWETIPEPVTSCGLCRWRERCGSEWSEADSLTLLAGITRGQRRKLSQAGVTAVNALAANARAVPGLPAEILAKLTMQAQLVAERRRGGQPSFRLKALAPLRGFNRIPRPSAHDLFFDMEGDPFVSGGLEYLFGIYGATGGDPEFRAWWAHTQDEERSAVQAVLAFFVRHLAAYPDAFIYHYNHYEVTALKRLTSKSGVGEIELDHLLKTKRFVDLYRIGQQAITTSESGNSLKDLEVFYMPARSMEITSAVGSVVAYENWLETHDQSILDDIAKYNETDCRSTLLFRDWLAGIRPADAVWFVPAESEPPPVDGDPDREVLRKQIEGSRERLGPDVADLLFELNAFHRRADKPEWWEYFDRQDRETDELVGDLECLADLTAIAPLSDSQRLYGYPAQETKLRKGSRVVVRGMPGAASITALSRDVREVTIKFPKKITAPPDRIDLIPQGPFNNTVLRDAVRRVTDSLVRGEARYQALEDFLHRRSPRIEGRPTGAPIVSGEAVVPETARAIAGLTASYLPIQGPPGTGKTYTSAFAIVDLVRQGKRIAVSSNAHKAIDNLLLAVANQARASGVALQIAKKASSGESDLNDALITLADDNDDPVLKSAAVVGGTAWLFARPDFDQFFDYLFIDEAGQVSLANLIAMGAAARNIVVVGDQMQLPQPLQGVHPGESGLSVLDYQLRDIRAVAADRGVFLPVSRRLHPDICGLISQIAYEGRLTSDREAANHRIDLAATAISIPSTGIMFVDVDHSGNGQSSAEEAERVAEFFHILLAGYFTDRDGERRSMSLNDILVVSPYNAQVNLLGERLPAGARVGTVDRFQGQEAPACLISFATSSSEELQRGIGFLFSLNRLNVAITRAQALAVVFASPRLLSIEVGTMNELHLVNGLCAVRDYARIRARG